MLYLDYLHLICLPFLSSTFPFLSFFAFRVLQFHVSICWFTNFGHQNESRMSARKHIRFKKLATGDAHDSGLIIFHDFHYCSLSIPKVNIHNILVLLWITIHSQRLC